MISIVFNYESNIFLKNQERYTNNIYINLYVEKI